MIEAKNLVKTFVRQVDKRKKEEFNAVDGISLRVNDGELVGILGPNGAGKTTLLRMLASLMTPTSGEINMPGKENLGYLSANTKLYERFSVRETMRLFGEIYGMSEEAISERTEFLADMLDLKPFLDNRIGKLSTGQLQRTQIARCLIHDPDYYIFDEPTLGLDVISSTAIIDFMKNEKNRGKTILYSTHYMEEAQYLCDRVLLLNQGKIICEDTPAHLMESTHSDTMRDAFFSCMKSWEERLVYL